LRLRVALGLRPGTLFGASFESLRLHRDLIHGHRRRTHTLGKSDLFAAEACRAHPSDVQHLLVWTRERQRDWLTRRWNQPQVLARLVEYLHSLHRTGIYCHIQTAFRINRDAIAVRALPFQLAELALIRCLPIRADVEHCDRAA